MGLFKYLLAKSLEKPGNEFAKQLYENLVLDQTTPAAVIADNGMTSDEPFSDEVDDDDSDGQNETKRVKLDSTVAACNPNERIDRWLHDQPDIAMAQSVGEEEETEEDTDEAVTLNLVEQGNGNENEEDTADSDKTEDGLESELDGAAGNDADTTMPALSLIGSDVFNQPLNVDDDEKATDSLSSLFDNSIAPIRTKKTTKANQLNFDMMNQIRASIIGPPPANATARQDDERPEDNEEITPNAMVPPQQLPQKTKTKRQRWSMEEDELLRKGFFKYKNCEDRWVMIKNKYFAGTTRTNVQIKDRARTMELF